MDRREALKRLGVGGALAVSAPVLLDSFNVAHAASGDPGSHEPPSGTDAVLPLPLSPKTNSVTIAFDTAAFGAGANQNLVFYWDVISATPPITIDERLAPDGSVAQLTKANGKGNMNKFVVQVVVWLDDTELATYHVISDGASISVTRVSPA